MMCIGPLSIWIMAGIHRDIEFIYINTYKNIQLATKYYIEDLNYITYQSFYSIETLQNVWSTLKVEYMILT